MSPDDDSSPIYPARPSDSPAIAGLFREDMTHLGVDSDRDELERLADNIIDGAERDPPECLCWVARPDEGADPVGVIVANFNWSLKFAGRSLWIEELYVTPESRRHGYGRALVDRVVEYAQNHDIRGIDLEAYQGNTPASVLYRTAGFRRLGRERFYRVIGEDQSL